MSLYADYLKEREGRETVEEQDGFATYCYPSAQVCYLVDIYVAPAARRQGLASKLADRVCEIAKAKGATALLGSVQPDLPSAAESMKALLGYGMRPTHIAGNLVYFVKEIK